jgi:hypothetical protein
MPTSPGSSALCRPRFATPATGRPNLAAGIAKTAELLRFETPLGPGLMPWQHDLNGVATELDAAGRFVYRQVVVEVMRQQGKSVDLLSMMVARALRRPGTSGGPGLRSPSWRRSSSPAVAPGLRPWSLRTAHCWAWSATRSRLVTVTTSTSVSSTRRGLRKTTTSSRRCARR